MENYFKGIKKDFSKFKISDFNEYIILSHDQINMYSDLVYNYGSKKEINYGRTISCYNPHNAVLFLNQDYSLKGYIEICFDCEKYQSSKEDYHLGDDCFNKYELLTHQFKNAGIEYVGKR